MRPLLVVLLALAGPAAATQEYVLPTRFDVTEIAEGDMLNVRAAPDGGAEIIGTLAPDATAVEVVAHDRTGRWGQINTAERSGWVAMRFLAYRTDVWQPGRLPEGLRCLGNEPFWSFAAKEGAVVLAEPGEADRRLPLASVLDTGVPGDPRRALVAEAEGLRLTATLTPQACSDGMSDRAYGLSTLAVREQAGGAGLLAGCCTLGR